MKINVVEEFIALASLNSPSRREAPVAAYLVKRLKELGRAATVDESAPLTGSDTGNLIVRVPGNTAGPTILLCAHMDTVGPTEGMTPVIRDGIIYSNGETVLGADDKAGIAIVLTVLAELLAGDVPHGGIEIVFTVQEEVGLVGAKHLQADLQADFGYILDSSEEVGSIINQAPSQVSLDFVLEGKAAHAGVCPEKGINAIVAAASAIARLRTGRIDAQTTSNVGLFNGGKARNIVPDRAEVAIEVRSTEKIKLEREVEAVLTAFNEAAAASGARLTVRRDEPFETFLIPEAHPVIANAFRAGRSIGIKPCLRTTGGGMDANVFNSCGLPCVGLGIGVADPHTPQEHISMAVLEAGVRFIKALIGEAVAAA
ncbi:MAG: M20/M25/M40 family metallo-hydrolase [Deltaproteobacteria bacterium]|nr:M20/M25/M40 family metallo-hydrolase [Deltaproteobacteria bacterium]MDA8126285.1 M20/M25/M40 family metallo-hydrolase [Deltaproteobacteria bacterium]